MHIHKYSQDSFDKTTACIHEREREKPSVNGFGIHVSPRISKSTTALKKLNTVSI